MRSSVSAIPSVSNCSLSLSDPLLTAATVRFRSAHVTSLLINLQWLPTAFRMKSRMKASSLTFEALLPGPARGPMSPATTKLPPNTPCTLQHPCPSRSCCSTCLGNVLLWPPT